MPSHSHHDHPHHHHAPNGPEQAAAGAVYVCPMHPEVRQDHPGRCPICQMMTR